MRTLLLTALLLTLVACSGGEPAATAAETVTTTVTTDPEPAETVTVNPATPTGTDLEPVCADFKAAVLAVRPDEAIDNALDLEDAARAELDPVGGQYFGVMAVVGALYALGLADEGLSDVDKAMDHLLDVSASIYAICDAG